MKHQRRFAPEGGRIGSESVAGFVGISTYAELDIYGIGFSDTIGTKIVRLGTHTLSLIDADDPDSWNPTSIYVSVPGGLPYGKEYEVFLMDGGQVISNRFNFLLLMWPEAVIPEQGPPGEQIRIEGLCMGETQGTKILKLGPHIINNILEWSNFLIRAEIPSVPAGTYDIYIEEGGTRISMKQSFKVL